MSFVLLHYQVLKFENLSFPLCCGAAFDFVHYVVTPSNWHYATD